MIDTFSSSMGSSLYAAIRSTAVEACMATIIKSYCSYTDGSLHNHACQTTQPSLSKQSLHLWHTTSPSRQRRDLIFSYTNCPPRELQAELLAAGAVDTVTITVGSVHDQRLLCATRGVLRRGQRTVGNGLQIGSRDRELR